MSREYPTLVAALKEKVRAAYTGKRSDAAP